MPTLYKTFVCSAAFVCKWFQQLEFLLES